MSAVPRSRILAHNSRSKKFFSPAQLPCNNDAKANTLATQVKIDMQTPFEIIIAYFCGALFAFVFFLSLLFLLQCVNKQPTWWVACKNILRMRAQTPSENESREFQLYQFDWDCKKTRETAKSCLNSVGKLFYYQILQFVCMVVFFPLVLFSSRDYATVLVEFNEFQFVLEICAIGVGSDGGNSDVPRFIKQTILNCQTQWSVPKNGTDSVHFSELLAIGSVIKTILWTNFIFDFFFAFNFNRFVTSFLFR